jgi:hypothetical protein
MYMKIGWKPFKVHNISTFTTTFATTTIVDTGKSTSY